MSKLSRDIAPLTISETLKWLTPLPILIQNYCWWWQCILPEPPHPALLTLLVSVDAKPILLWPLMSPWYQPGVHIAITVPSGRSLLAVCGSRRNPPIRPTNHAATRVQHVIHCPTDDLSIALQQLRVLKEPAPQAYYSTELYTESVLWFKDLVDDSFVAIKQFRVLKEPSPQAY